MAPVRGQQRPDSIRQSQRDFNFSPQIQTYGKACSIPQQLCANSVSEPFARTSADIYVRHLSNRGRNEFPKSRQMRCLSDEQITDNEGNVILVLVFLGAFIGFSLQTKQ